MNRTPECFPVTGVVTPNILSALFSVVAKSILEAHEGQRLGNYVAAYDNGLRIKEHPVRQRVTHAELVDLLDIPGSVPAHAVTHQVHLPSKDRTVGDYDASQAIFEVHEHDEAGEQVYTQRTVLNRIDLAGPEIEPFIVRIAELDI